MGQAIPYSRLCISKLVCQTIIMLSIQSKIKHSLSDINLELFMGFTVVNATGIAYENKTDLKEIKVLNIPQQMQIQAILAVHFIMIILQYNNIVSLKCVDYTEIE